MNEPITPSQFRKPVSKKPDPMKVVYWILGAFLFIAGLNLTPGYHALQERNRMSVLPPRSEVNEPR